MSGTRRTHGASLQSKAALAAVRGDKTDGPVRRAHKPDDGLEEALLEGVPELFATDGLSGRTRHRQASRICTNISVT